MVSATLSRGGTTFNLPLQREGGEILVASTFGKPEIQIRQSGGTLNPRANDRWSGLHQIELQGMLFDYVESHDLADLIKSASTDPLELELPSSLYPDTLTVAPAAGGDSALSLVYPAGRTDMIDVSLSLTRVGDVRGIKDQQAETPRQSSGNGPVVVRAGSESVELPTADLSVERTVGRPNDTVRRVPSRADPRYEVKPKVTSDVFTLSFETVTDVPQTLTSLTQSVFRQQLGRGGVELDFQGLLGLGSVDVVPVGSSSFRQVQQAGQQRVSAPTLEFRRVFSPR